MSKIHEGLSNKPILSGNASDYGCVRVETCAVSGQLATEACRNDVMGYGTVSDYWANGTQPTVYCQMHETQTICAETGMAASPYCPNPVTRGVITIPAGHPLYQFVGSRYQDVLEQYLGSVAASSGMICTYHNEYNQGQTVSPVTASLIADAQTLLVSAGTMMNGMDPSTAHYAAIYQAAIYLNSVIQQQAPSQNDVAAAMAALTQAMAGIY
jgi:penicillin-binding protein 1A